MLRVTGTDGPDTIKVAQADDAHYTVVVNGEPAQSFDAAAVRRAVIDALGGDDKVVVGQQAGGATALPVRVDGGAGKDDLRTDAGNDLLVGGDGDDYLFAAGGSDRTYGGAGNDRVLVGPGRDAVWAGDGNDFIHVGYPDTRLTAYGGEGDDRMHGGTNRDVLFGGPGGDLIAGNGGTDLLVGGPGRDLLSPVLIMAGPRARPGYCRGTMIRALNEITIRSRWPWYGVAECST